MALDNKAIETLSVNAVRDTVVMSEFLDQYIPDNDKEPSWDGSVYIYSDKSKKKEKLKGRMPVQVKGKECDDFSKEEISFLMSTTDLRNYLYDGGCILFVVYIGNHGLRKKVYYLELTPIKLRKLLDEAGTQKSKTVHLKEFPITDNNKKATIFLNCLQNCQKQASFKEGKLFSLEELEEQGVLEKIVIPFDGVGYDDPQMAIMKNEVYVYANIKGSSILQPIEMITAELHTQEYIDGLVKVGDKIFYTKYKLIKSAKKTSFQFGDSFTISFSEPDKPCQISYKNSSKIKVLAKDLDFMLSCLDNGCFSLKGIDFPLNGDEIDSSNFDIKKEKEHLQYAKDIVKVLDMLGCNEDIDIKDMSDEDWRNLNRLITALIEKKPVSGLKENLTAVQCIKVGKLKFAIYLKKLNNSEKGTYEIYDFFKTDISVAFKDVKGDMLPISQFSILHKEDFLNLNNLNFDILLPSFQKAEHHYETFNRANWFLLDMLSAYDEAKGLRKSQIIKTCEEFSDWIFQANDDELDYNIKVLNKLQTTKRIRELNIEEMSLLYEMIENNDTREDCRVGAYLLLDLQQAAEIHFSRLTIEEQESFKKYPIYHFCKNHKE